MQSHLSPRLSEKATLLLALITLSLAPLSAVSAAPSTTQSAIQKYLHRLVALPLGAAPASVVNSLAVNLTKLQPARAIKFYEIGFARLGDSNGTRNTDATRIAQRLILILKKSGVPDENRIIESLYHLAPGPGCGSIPMPTS